MRLRGLEMKQKGMCKNTVVNTGVLFTVLTYIYTPFYCSFA